MMSKQQKPTLKKASIPVLSRTKLYGFELFMASVGLLAMAFVVDYGIFSLFRHFSRSGDSFQGSDQVVIFLVAALIVWLPVASIFYLRARGELQVSSKQAQTKVHRVIVSMYMVINTIVSIGALFYAVYALLEMMIGSSPESINPIIRQILPGLLMALWHGWLLLAFTGSRRISRQVFSTSYAAVTIAVILMLFAATVSGIQSQTLDQQRESDMSLIQDAITIYYDDNSKLPLSLEDVELINLKNDASEYNYQAKDAKRYELCSTFSLNTTSKQAAYAPYDSSYTSYPSWSQHNAGRYCYKVKIVIDEA